MLIATLSEAVSYISLTIAFSLRVAIKLIHQFSLPGKHIGIGNLGDQVRYVLPNIVVLYPNALLDTLANDIPAQSLPGLLGKVVIDEEINACARRFFDSTLSTTLFNSFGGSLQGLPQRERLLMVLLSRVRNF